jgi:putative effector of murein hydrolase
MARLPQLAVLLLLTLALYMLACRLAARFRHPLLHPLPLCAGAIILVLHQTGTAYATYAPIRDLASWLLGPATVALAVPLHHQRARLRALALPLAAGTAVGTMATIAAVLALSALGHLAPVVRATLAFKSVTTPIAVALVHLHGGDPALAAVFVVVTGITGAVLGPPLLTRCRVVDAVARGVALGTISHAIGTAAALAEGEAAGAAAGVAMIAAAMLTTVLAPFFLPLLLHLLGV